MTTSEAIQRVREVIRRQHKAFSTEGSYVFWIRRYTAALRLIPRELSSEKKIERFLTGLALRDNVSASTQNQALNAILFFYKNVLEQPIGRVDALRANRPVHERHAPSVTETRALLQITPAATPAAANGSATGCTKQTFSVPSSGLAANSAFQSCPTSCATAMQRIVWNVASIRAQFRRRWDTSHWRRPWVTCTQKL